MIKENEVSILDEYEAKHAAEAAEKIQQGFVRIERKDGGVYVYSAYSSAGLNGGWGALFGPFANDDEAASFIDAGSFVATYRAGHGVWKIGYRVRYVGKTKPGGTKYVEDCPIGTEAVIVGDNGYDYRYTLSFDNGPTPCVISSRHPNGEFKHTRWRSGGSGWERIMEDQ
jgi:hypothetical protein